MTIGSRNIPSDKGCFGLQPRSVRGPCALGFDIKPDRWDVVVLDYHQLGELTRVPRLVFVGELHDERDIEFLASQYPVIVGVGDCRPDTTLAKRLQKTMQARNVLWWRAQYNPHPTLVERTFNDKEGLVTLERTMALDKVLYAFTTKQIAIPENFVEIKAGKFVTELCSPTKIPIIWQGQEWQRWEKSGPDDAMHALAYALVAAEIGKLSLPRGDALLPQKGLVVSSYQAKPLDIFRDDPEDQVGWDDGGESMGPAGTMSFGLDDG